MGSLVTLPAEVIAELERVLGGEQAAGVLQVLHTIETFTSGLVDRLSSAAYATYDNVRSFIDYIEHTIFDRVTSAVTGVEKAVEGISTRLETAIGQMANLLNATLANIVNSISAIVSRMASAFESIASTIATSITNALQGIVGEIERVIQQTMNVVTQTLAQLFDVLTAAYNYASDRITEAINGLITSYKAIWEGITQRIHDALAAVYHTIEGVVSYIESIVKGAFDNLVHKITELWDIGLNDVERFIAWLNDHIWTPVWGFITSNVGELRTVDTMLLGQIIEPIIANPYTPNWLGEIFNGDTFVNLLMQFAVTTFSMAVYIPQVLSAVYAGPLALTQQYSMGEYHAGPLPTSELVQAVWRGGISHSDALDQAFRQGIDSEHFDVLQENYQKYLAPGDYVTLYFRGVIDRGRLDEELGAQGFTAVRIQEMITAGEYVPPIPDLIRFLVREVFTPDVANRFGQFEDYPEMFDSLAAQQGLSSDWAKAYWAAHWELPSLTEGFQMYHRGIITEADLKLLARALDVMPFWRDNLIQMSYNPLTRVDVRRMYNMDVLSDDDVLRAYQDIGYSPENAQRLLLYTKKLKEEGQDGAHAHHKELARAQIDRAYLEHMIDQSGAMALYEEIGYSEHDALFMLAMIDFEQAMRTRQQGINRLKTEYNAGLLDDVHLWEQLGILGLSYDEQVAVKAQILYEDIPKPRIPTRAEFEDMYKAGIIDDAYLNDAYRRLGYSTEHAGMLLQLVITKGSKKNAKG